MKHQKRILGLDGIRGIAVIGVILYHLIPSVVPGGFLGVNFFFVLSGYLIVLAGAKNKVNGRFALGRYWKKRIRRIYPALVLVILWSSFFARIIHPASLAGARKEVFAILTGWDNIYQIHKQASYFARMSDTSIFTHMWSIAIELQFYLIAPIFLIYAFRGRVERRRTVNVLLLLSLASALAEALLYSSEKDPTYIYYGTFTRMYALFLGAALGLSKPDRDRRRKQAAQLSPLVSALLFFPSVGLLVFLFLTARGTDALTYRLFLPLSAILCVFLILQCEDSTSAASSCLSLPAVVVPGRLSYELYLVMYPIIALVRGKREPGVLDSIIIAVLIIIAARILHFVCQRLTSLPRHRSLNNAGRTRHLEGGTSNA